MAYRLRLFLGLTLMRYEAAYVSRPMKISFQFDTDDENDRNKMQSALKLWQLDSSDNQLAAEVAGVCAMKSGEKLVKGAAENFEAETTFTQAELAAAIGEAAGDVAAWFRVLGRREKALGWKIFTRGTGPGNIRTYSMSPEMRTAVLAVAGE